MYLCLENKILNTLCHPKKLSKSIIKQCRINKLCCWNGTKSLAKVCYNTLHKTTRQVIVKLQASKGTRKNGKVVPICTFLLFIESQNIPLINIQLMRLYLRILLECIYNYCSQNMYAYFFNTMYMNSNQTLIRV